LGRRTLQELQDTPRIVFNETNGRSFAGIHETVHARLPRVGKPSDRLIYAVRDAPIDKPAGPEPAVGV
jgi:hypothetical protein